MRPASDPVLEHFANPRHVGSLAEDDPQVGTGMAGAPVRGGVIRMQVRVDRRGFIEDMRVKSYGGPAVIAAGSLLADWVQGRSLESVRQADPGRLAEALALPAVQLAAAVLAVDALRAAIDDYQRRRPPDPD
ncbi:MAG: iron-sulfur cluster assembly scaffold protein [Pseudomonadota bacterium]|nr:iron-sulfur cluster assembly scaffold protein [Pseudomonadota bacterium]